MNNKVIFSSDFQEWETPQSLFDQLDARYHFTLDACATPQNAKCSKYFTKANDGLAQTWRDEIVFCNPPYGKNMTAKWVRKAYNEATSGAKIVMLVPARTDTAWFHDYVYCKHRIEFIRGRLKFSNADNVAPFPSMLIFFNL